MLLILISLSNDPVSRRFIQYLAMQACRLVVLVRDAKTGKIIVEPPEDQLWLIREKAGLGRAAKNEWNNIKSVGPDFFEEMDERRQWHFGFQEHYDIYVWDLEAGNAWTDLYSNVQGTLLRAHRMIRGSDYFNTSAHILKTITHDPNQRVRDIKPGEHIRSIYEELCDPATTKYRFAGDEDTTDVLPPHLVYSEADALEDAVLFPEEEQAHAKLSLAGTSLDERKPDFTRFISGIDSDNESDDENSDEVPDGFKLFTLDEYGEMLAQKQGFETIASARLERGIRKIDPAHRENMEKFAKLYKMWRSLEEFDDTEAEFMKFVDKQRAKRKQTFSQSSSGHLLTFV